jgi:hypothetical protein
MPPIIGCFVCDHAQQKRQVRKPENIFRNMQEEDIPGVPVFDILQLEIRGLYFLF